LKDRDKRKCEGQLDQIPIIFRFLVSVCFILCGFFGSLSGWNHFDNNRRFLRAALIWGRSLVGLLWFVLCLLLSKQESEQYYNREKEAHNLSMKQPEYMEGPEALENFQRLATAILQAPTKKQKRGGWATSTWEV